MANRILEISPEILRERHRLSAQQINLLFGKDTIEENVVEKARNLEKVAEFLWITDTLTKNAISFFSLKGPLLSYKIYGDASFRYYRDLDIVIDSNEVLNVKNMLHTLGYQDYGRSLPTNKKKLRRSLHYYHDILLFHPTKNISIELHWRFLPRHHMNDSIENTTIQNNLTEIYFTDRAFTTMNNEMELLYLIIHGGMHRWGRLKWLMDVNDFLKVQRINWENFQKLVITFNASRLVTLCKRMLTEYFEQENPIPCKQDMPSFMFRVSMKSIENKQYNPSDLKDVFQRQLFYLLAFPGTSYKISILNSIVFNSGLPGRVRQKLRQLTERTER